ncbi:hypothetical protein BP5796_10276 [Coleophoma crateriformis]|uniref:HD/PDEase domain-containing protein n=1 Tax=Coleophoma crateriformis TaxID=565419 RepID=A0A3D8QVP2_9HELO|nr:hypothetical protein BP5796_10276 [Coleophoma crateriformis]
MCQFTNDQQEATSTPEQTAEVIRAKYVPDSKLCQTAFTYAAQHLGPSILHHSIRVYLYTQALSSKLEKPSSKNLTTMLFIAAMFHDIGTHDAFNGPGRFEVCGADAAVTFLRANAHDHDMTEAELQEIWIGIACHTSPEIAERISAFSKLIRLAVLTDFDRPGLRREFQVEELTAEIETSLPRLAIEKILGDAVVRQIMGKKEGADRLRKGPNNSWPGSLLRGELEKEPGYAGVNKYF